MSFNYSDAEKGKEGGPIPAGTVVPVVVNIQLPIGQHKVPFAGALSDEYKSERWLFGTLDKNKARNIACIHYALIVSHGSFKGRYIFGDLGLYSNGTDEGQTQMVNMSRMNVRSIIESARNINPDDKSEEADKKRTIESHSELHGMALVVRVAVDSEYNPDKPYNEVQDFITPSMKDYQHLEQPNDVTPLVKPQDQQATQGGEQSSQQGGGSGAWA